MPQYGEFWVDRFGEADQVDYCPACGAVVADTAKHDEWHADIASMARKTDSATARLAVYG